MLKLPTDTNSVKSAAINPGVLLSPETASAPAAEEAKQAVGSLDQASKNLSTLSNRLSSAMENNLHASFRNQLQKLSSQQTIAREVDSIGVLTAKTAYNMSVINENERRQELQLQEQEYALTTKTKLQELAFNIDTTMRESIAPDGTGHTVNVLSAFDKSAEAFITNAPTRESSLNTAAFIADLRLQLQTTSYGVEKKKRQEYTVSNVTSTMDRLATQSFNNPGNSQTYLNELEIVPDLLRKNNIAETDIQQMMQNGRDKIMSAELLKLSDSQPLEALELARNPYYDSMSFPARLRLYESLTDKSRTFVREQQKLEKEFALKQLFVSGVPLDPKNKDHQQAADLVYADFVASMYTDGKLNVSSNEYFENVVDFMQKNPDVMPSQLASQLNSFILNGDPEQALIGSRIMEQLTSDPRLARLLDSDNIDRKSRDEGFAIFDMVSSGVNPKVAVENVRNRLRNIGPDRIQALTEEFDTEVKKSGFNARDIIQDALDGSEDIMGAAVPAFMRAYKNSYLNLQDFKLAQKAALASIKVRFSTTDVNGKDEVMEFGPELIFPNHVDEFKQTWDQQKATMGISPDKLVLRGTYSTKTSRLYPIYEVRENGYEVFTGKYFQFVPGTSQAELEQMENLKISRERQAELNALDKELNKKLQDMKAELLSIKANKKVEE